MGFVLLLGAFFLVCWIFVLGLGVGFMIFRREVFYCGGFVRLVLGYMGFIQYCYFVLVFVKVLGSDRKIGQQFSFLDWGGGQIGKDFCIGGIEEGGVQFYGQCQTGIRINNESKYCYSFDFMLGFVLSIRGGFI